jgi:L-aminopeptidase/D-esterase-like protein
VITDVPGVRVGHWTDDTAMTGCTVVLFPEGTVASGEIRGGAPGTREWALLAPERLVDRIDAVVLSGGSAFGLAACDGAMRWCAERGLGYPTAGGPVPIVVGAVLFDIAVGDGSVRPDAAAGYAACVSATDGGVASGRVGAAAGATVNKWRGREHMRWGGLASTAERDGALIVGALVAVNAFGDVVSDGTPVDATNGAPLVAQPFHQNTTLAVIATNAKLDKVGCLLVAQAAQDAFARAIHPAHAAADGDAVVAAATGHVDAPVESVRLAAGRATVAAIRSAVPA